MTQIPPTPSPSPPREDARGEGKRQRCAHLTRSTIVVRVRNKRRDWRQDMNHITKLAVVGALSIACISPAPAAEISPELIAKAKQEGQVTYYTDLIVDQIVRPLTTAFEAKYGIKVAYTRGDSQVNSIKLLN